MLRRRFPRCAAAFLHRVWEPLREGVVFLAARSSGGRWNEEGFELARARECVKAFLHTYDPADADLYFCPNAFERDQRRSDNCLPTKLAHSDIDHGWVAGFRPSPTILIETSPGRHQGLWEFEDSADPRQAEAVSKHLAYKYGGDRNGWSCTKMLRLPFTINHKPAYHKPEVKLLHYLPPLVEWPAIERVMRASAAGVIEINPETHDPTAVVERYRSRIRYRYVSLMKHQRVLSPDRSRCIFMMVAALHKAGASPNEIAAVVWRSPYFVSKHGKDGCVLSVEIHRILGKLP